MKIETAFDINEKVVIIPIERDGVVTEIKISAGNIILYRVSYWRNSEKYFIWLDESELNLK